jgi:hypothetical protein
MITPSLRVDRIIFPIIVSTTVCVLVGMLFTNYRVLDVSSPGFQFLAYAVIASGFYTVLRFSSERNAMLLLGILFLIYLYITRSSELMPIFRNFMVVAGIAIVTYVFQKIIDGVFDEIRFGKFLIWGALYGIVYIFVTVVLVSLLGSENSGYYYMNNLRLGFLMGIGLGLGLEISDLIDRFIFR